MRWLLAATLPPGIGVGQVQVPGGATKIDQGGTTM
jgi:hypothetical protein